MRMTKNGIFYSQFESGLISEPFLNFCTENFQPCKNKITMQTNGIKRLLVMNFQQI